MASNLYRVRLHKFECRRCERVRRSREAFDDGVRVSLYRRSPLRLDASLPGVSQVQVSFPTRDRKIKGWILADEIP